MITLTQLITSFIASAGFGILFNAPRKVILQSGLVGMCGWVLYFQLTQANIEIIAATLFAALLVGVLSRICAVLWKSPIIIFYVSGIIPLVPGSIAYDAMRHFVLNNYFTGVQLATKVMLLAGAIAVGLMFSEVAHKIYLKIKWRSIKT